MRQKIEHIPTNIITGFLGTGKTSLIQHVLTHKPINERWAVLVNEFGSIGIDATMYQNQHQDEGGVFVREVPGGCMCCVSGLPMQIALHVLLKLSNPHRLLIEPSGLGHPIEVVSLLMSTHYKEVLDIQQILTVIDPRHVLDDQYFTHPTFQQQLSIADTWVFNKFNQQARKNHVKVQNKIKTLELSTKNQINTEFGQVELNVLVGKTQFNPADVVEIRQPNTPLSEELPEPQPIPADHVFLKETRTDEGYHGTSWRFNKTSVFNQTKLLKWIKSIHAERIKAVFKTNDGIIGINKTKDQLQLIPFGQCEESKLEIISKSVDPDWDKRIKECLKTQHATKKVSVQPTN